MIVRSLQWGCTTRRITVTVRSQVYPTLPVIAPLCDAVTFNEPQAVRNTG